MKKGTMNPRAFKQARKALGLTRTEIAVKLNRSEQSVFSYESGKRNITDDIQNKVMELMIEKYPLVKIDA